MSCPLNKETVTNGIINEVNHSLLISGNFVKEANLRMIKEEGKETINKINEEFGDPTLVTEDNKIVTINPSNELVDAYLESADAERIVDDVLVKTTAPTNQASNVKQRAKIRSLLDKMGVDIENISNLQVNGKAVTEDGIALPLQALVAYAEGKEDTLPEEAFHIAVELLSQTKPGLLNLMMAEITNLPIYQETKKAYENNPQYTEVKIKKEAIAKQLAVQFEQSDKIKKWWERAIEWLKNLFIQSKADLSPFTTSLEQIFSKDIGTVRNTLLNNKVYLLSKGMNEEVVNEIINMANSTMSDYELKHRMRQYEPSEVFYSLPPKANAIAALIEKITLKTGLTDAIEKAKQALLEKYPDATSAEYKKALDILTKTDKTELFNILKQYFTPSGELKTNPVINTTNTDLQAYIETKLLQFPNARFFVQKEISGKKLTATPDLLIVDEQGVTHIINFVDSQAEPKALDSQIIAVKEILKDNGVTKTGQARTLQINRDYTNTNDFLDITTKYDKIGVAKIDKLLAQLNKIVGDKADDRKGNQIIYRVFKAVRQIQTNGNIDPLEKVIKTINDNIENINERYDNLTGTESAEELDMLRKDMERYYSLAQQLKDASAAFFNAEKENPQLFSGIDLSYLKRQSGKLSETTKELKSRITAMADMYAKQMGVEDVSTIERAVSGLTMYARRFSQGQTRATRLLFRVITRITNETDQEVERNYSTIEKLKEAYDKVSNKYKNYLQPIAMKDSKGNYIHKLISKYDRAAFKSGLEKAIANNDTSWVKNNIDYKAYKTWYNEARKEEFDTIDSLTYWENDPIENEKIQDEQKKNWEEKYDIDNFVSKNNKEISKFITDKHLSKEYKNLKTNKPVYDLYNYILDINMRAYRSGALTLEQAESLIPSMTKNFAEKALTGGKITLAGGLQHLLTTEEQAQMANIDPLTGELTETIPYYYTKDLSTENKDGSRDYSNVSQDIFKILPTHLHQTIKYEKLKDELPSIQLVKDVERTKQALKSNLYGDVIEGEDAIPNNDTNFKYFNSYLKAYFFGHRDMTKSGDTKLISVKAEAAKKVNKLLGRQVLSEAEGDLTLNNTIDAANKLFTLKVLGLNITIPLVNMIGSSMQAVVNSGKYFSSGEFLETEFRIFRGGYLSKDEQTKVHGLAEYFQMFYEGESRRRFSEKMSINKAMSKTIPEWMMSLQNYSEKPIELAIGLSMLNNFMVDNGKIVSISEYVTNKYADRYNKSASELKALEAKIKEEIKTLKATKSINKIAVIKGDTLEIPGINRGDDTVHEFATLVKQVTMRATGGGNREDIRLANMTLIGRSFMVFKSWMPQLFLNRVQKLNYVEGTQSYEMGRWNALGDVIMTKANGHFANLYNALSMNDKGIELLKEVYINKKAQYESNTGLELNMTEAEFIDMYRMHIRNLIKEAGAIATVAAMFFGFAAMQPPDDESKGAYKYAYKVMDKIKNEMLFFYNPFDLAKVADGSIFPAVGVAKDMLSLSTEATKSFKAHAFGTEEEQNKVHFVKKFAAAFPLTYQVAPFVVVFNEEAAKELGMDIKIDKKLGD